MKDELIFKTKTGYCHILADRIVLTRDGIIGNISKVTIGNQIGRALLIGGGISIFFLYTALTNYQKEAKLTALFYGLVSGLLMYDTISSLNHSATPIILRSKIKKIKFKRGVSGLTRSRFEVFFENDKNKIKKRLILLPGSLTGGQRETEKAIKILVQEKLLEKTNER